VKFDINFRYSGYIGTIVEGVYYQRYDEITDVDLPYGKEAWILFGCINTDSLEYQLIAT
jgi:hypothetical protein